MSRWFHRIEKGLERVHLVAWLWNIISPAATALSILIGVLVAVIAAMDSQLGLVGLTLLALLCAAVGVLVCVGTVVVWNRLFGRTQEAQKATTSPDDLIPLGEAARLAYEAVEGSLMARFARSQNSDPDAILCHFAERIYNLVSILGKRLPSTQLRPIGDLVLIACRFAQGGNAMVLAHNQEVAYVDLQVRRSDFQDALLQLIAAKDGETVAAGGTQDLMLPLRDAVGKALAATRDTALADFHAGYKSSEREIVYGYFVEMVDRKIPVYGKTPPADDWVVLEDFDPNEETLTDDMKSIQPHHQECRLTDLSVKLDDLSQFIELIRRESGATARA